MQPSKLETLDDLLAQAEHYANYSMRNMGRMPPTLFLIGPDGPLLFIPESVADGAVTSNLLRPPGSPTWGKAHKDFQRRFYRRSMGVQGPVQEMPVARVEVDPEVKDHWGIPVARLSGQRHPHDIEICQFTSAKAEQWLKEAGAIQTWRTVPGRGLSGGQHQAGTCRMGDDPKTSVTAKYGSVHA